jgi:hypothetical protein
MIVDARQHVGKPGPRINVVELTGLYQRQHDCRTFTIAIGACEQSRLSSECNPTQLTFGRIVTQADAAILKEAREDIDALEHVVKSLGNFVMARQLGPLPLHPLDELIH